jgi:hypothetical protein
MRRSSEVLGGEPCTSRTWLQGYLARLEVEPDALRRVILSAAYAGLSDRLNGHGISREFDAEFFSGFAELDDCGEKPVCGGIAGGAAEQVRKLVILEIPDGVAGAVSEPFQRIRMRVYRCAIHLAEFAIMGFPRPFGTRFHADLNSFAALLLLLAEQAVDHTLINLHICYSD